MYFVATNLSLMSRMFREIWYIAANYDIGKKFFPLLISCTLELRHRAVRCCDSIPSNMSRLQVSESFVQMVYLKQSRILLCVCFSCSAPTSVNQKIHKVNIFSFHFFISFKYCMLQLLNIANIKHCTENISV